MMWDLEKYHDRTAMLDEFGTAVTYGELAAEGERLSAAAGGRCLVFCLCTNTVGSIVGYVSFMNAGIVPVLLNAHLERALLDDLLAAYAPKYLWVPAEQAGDFGGMESVYSAYGYSLLRTGYPTEYPLFPELAFCSPPPAPPAARSSCARATPTSWPTPGPSYSTWSWTRRKSPSPPCP